MTAILTTTNYIVIGFLSVVHAKSTISKFRHPYAFLKITEQYNIIKNQTMLKLATTGVVVAEFSVAFMILLPQLRLIGSGIGIILQLIFSVLMIKNFGKTFRYGCGCFGINTPVKITFNHILLNLLIVIGLVIINI